MKDKDQFRVKRRSTHRTNLATIIETTPYKMPHFWSAVSLFKHLDCCINLRLLSNRGCVRIHENSITSFICSSQTVHIIKATWTASNFSSLLLQIEEAHLQTVRHPKRREHAPVCSSNPASGLSPSMGMDFHYVQPTELKPLEYLEHQWLQ